MSDFNLLAGATTGALGFYTAGSTTVYEAIQNIKTDNNTMGLKFNTKASGTDTERMRITSAGNIGIGTTSPSKSLEISGGASRSLLVNSTSGTSTISAQKDGNYAQIGGDGTSGFIKYGHTTTTTARNLRFFQGGGSEVMRLDSYGRLMIGTTTASGTLTVDPDENASITFGKAKFYSAVSDYMYLSHFDYATMSNYALNQGPTGSTTLNAPSGQTVGLSINNSRKLTVNATGNVGIGTSSPTHGKLEVRGVANDTTIAIHEDDGTHKAQLHLRSGGNDVKLYQSGTDNKFHIDTESVSKAFTLATDGKFGLNEDSPLASLHINKIGSVSPIIFNDGYYGYGIGGGQLPSDVDPNSNNFRMYMSTTRLHMVTSHGSGQFRWLNGTSNRRMTLDNNGNLAIGLNVDPSHKLDIQGSSSSGTIVQIRDTGDDYPVGITYNHGVAGHQTAWYAGTMDGGSGERKFTIGAKASNGFHNDLTTSSYSLMELSHMDSSVQFRSGKVWIGNTHNNGQTWSSMGSKGNELILDGGANSGLTIVTGSNEAGYITHNNYNNSDYQHINFDSANAGMFFKAGGTDNVLVLKSAGVGIGVASPSYKLDLLDGMRINRSSNDPYILFARAVTSVEQIRVVNGGGINITDGGSSNSRIYVNSSGDVGIGDVTPTAKLDVNGTLKVQNSSQFQGSATFDTSATFEDMATFNSDVDFTNSSIEGLPAITVSPTTIFKCATTATNINFGVSLTKGDILFGTPTTENGTYISHTNNDEKITLKRAGEYEISVTLVVTAQSASNRFTCLTYVEHYNSSNTLLDSYGLEAMYIRSNGTNYNSGAMAGQIRITTGSLNTWVKVTSMVLDRESTGTVPLNTTYSKIRIDKIEYNQ
jgi:hypothetical protein